MSPSLGVVTTGNGEEIINSVLAFRLAQQDALPSEILRSRNQIMSGFLMVECHQQPRKKKDRKFDKGVFSSVTLSADHTLSHMVVGYQSSGMEGPVTKVLDSTAPALMESIAL